MDERIELLEEAREAIELAVENIRAAAYGTKFELRAKSYIIPHLLAWVDGREMITIQEMIDEFRRMNNAARWSEEDIARLVARLEDEYEVDTATAQDIVADAVQRSLLSEYEPDDDEVLQKLAKTYHL